MTKRGYVTWLCWYVGLLTYAVQTRTDPHAVAIIVIAIVVVTVAVAAACRRDGDCFYGACTHAY